MAEDIVIVVPGVPVAKGRGRVSTFGGRPRVITPSKTRNYENMVRHEAALVMGSRPPLEGALIVLVSAYVPMPVNLSKVKRQLAIDGKLRPITRPDVDNYAKAALDGLNAIVFRDDSQIVYLSVAKHYAERPRLEVTVSEFD